MTTEALKPCPFCGGTDLAIETDRVMPDNYHNGHVYCSDCDAEGAAALSVNNSWLASEGEAKAAAITAWNTRPTPLAPWRREAAELALFIQQLAAMRAADPPAIQQRVAKGALNTISEKAASLLAILSRPAPTQSDDLLLFNLNHDVRVKLTPVGREILRKQHDALMAAYGDKYPFVEPATDADGWSRFQMWDLMNELGAACFMGCRTPFETTVAFERKDLKPDGVGTDPADQAHEASQDEASAKPNGTNQDLSSAAPLPPLQKAEGESA